MKEPTWPVTHCRIEWDTDDADIKELGGISETLDVLQVSKRSYARE